MSLEFRIRILHQIYDEVGDLVEEGALESERVMSLINPTSHNLSEDVVSPLIARKNPISDCERSGTRVIRNDAHREAFLSLGLVVSIGESSGEIDYGSNQISVVVGLDVLQNNRETLQTSTCIDRWFR